MKNTPERIYIPEFAKESFKTMDWCPSKDRRSKDEDIEYIRKDISDEYGAKKYFEGMNNAKYTLDLFTKEECKAREKEAYDRAKEEAVNNLWKSASLHGTFTKEQVVELMKKAWNEGDNHNRNYGFSDWMNWKKPLDSK